MRIYIVIGCMALLGPISQHKVLGSRNTESDLYLEDFGSGDGPEVVDGPGLTHIDHEGSGHGVAGGPYGTVVYDMYDNTYDDTEDDDYYEDNFDLGYDEEIAGEGSGGDKLFIDGRDDDTDIREEEGKPEVIKVIEEIIVEEQPTLEEHPPTTPPPSQTDSRDMDSPIQIHTAKTDDRQVSIFAQPGILAAFIGGAVVGLLCAILLVMFIVYRMRKKDEGSYPLDEPKRMPLTSSYSPNDKEIYA